MMSRARLPDCRHVKTTESASRPNERDGFCPRPIVYVKKTKSKKMPKRPFQINGKTVFEKDIYTDVLR